MYVYRALAGISNAGVWVLYFWFCRGGDGRWDGRGREGERRLGVLLRRWLWVWWVMGRRAWVGVRCECFVGDFVGWCFGGDVR